METTHGLTVVFMDGSKISYNFPDQARNSAARQIRLEEFLKSPYLLVIADGMLHALPVANIKAILLPVDEGATEEMRLPAHVFRGAKVTRGDL
jgi:hypothetical protein